MKKFIIYLMVLFPVLFMLIGEFVEDISRPLHNLVNDIFDGLKFLMPIIIIVFIGYCLSNLVIYLISEDIEKKNKAKKYFLNFLIISIVLFMELLIMTAASQTFGKPIIYLYPTSVEQINVKLDFKGTVIADYPKYDLLKGWEVTAFPDGKIIDKDSKEYSYLFWEGNPDIRTNFDFSTGYVIKGEDTREFFQEILPKFGFSSKEYNEFIVYWYPIMQNNKYNLIHFATNEYTDVVGLDITPKPDSVLRMLMAYKSLSKPIDVEPQEIKPFVRNGFTVVEWGGTEIK